MKINLNFNSKIDNIYNSIIKSSPRLPKTAKDAFVSVKNTALSELEAKVKIENFHKVTQKLYRSANLSAADISDLAKINVTKIIDLRSFPELILTEILSRKNSFSKQKKEAQKYGIKIVRIGMFPNRAPAAGKTKQVLEEIKNNKGASLIHCTYGKDRTGFEIACYRILNEGFSFKEAFAEMKAKGHRYMLLPNYGQKLQKWASVITKTISGSQ